MTAQRLTSLLLTALAVLAILAPAGSAASVQNRVRAFHLAAHTHTEANPTESPWTRPGSLLSMPKFAAGCCVAAKETGEVFPRIAGGASGAGGRAGKLRPDGSAIGPHTVFRRGQDGRIDKYTTFDELGNETLRFRGSGGSHAGLEPPLFYGAKPGKGLGAPLNRARNPVPDDYQNLPPGY